MPSGVDRLAGLSLLCSVLGVGCGARTTLSLDRSHQSDAGSGGRTNTTAGTSTDATDAFGTDGTTGSNTPQRKLDKLDILLSVDDSISMADKQRLLQQAVPDLIGRLANPLCVDDDRSAYPELTPPSGQDCPRAPSGERLEREFLPVSDIHVGLVTSSLGKAGVIGAANNYAHLLGSFRAGLPGMTPEGFLAWEPGKPQNVFAEEVAALMGAVGESGSGYESPLEAWLRFLVDPEPYADLRWTCAAGAVEGECVVPEGLDTTLLGQRQAFLRPDSVLVIVVLSDEDDCSVRPEPTSWELLPSDNHPFRGNSMCEIDPDDPCCLPCNVAVPPECPGVTCPEDPLLRDSSNLRCWEQKRRFGRDVLYPVERYRTALSQRELCLDSPDLSMSDSCSRTAQNPLFIDLATGAPAPRTPQAVFLTFIVGVPWQDLAVDPLVLMDPAVDGLTFKSPTELSRDGSFGLLIGDTLAPPIDPLMLQAVDPRSGVHPITGETIAGPAAWPVVNSINGHDRDIPARDDLQYACTFPLPELRDCSATDGACDCTDPIAGQSPNNPMCQDPNTGTYSTLQHSGKAYPGQRYMRLAQQLGDQSVLSSICARNTRDPSRSDYAYRPAVSSLISRIAPILQQPK